MCYSRKIQTEGRRGGLRKYFFQKNPGNFGFVTLSLEVLEKAKLHFWIFHIVVWHPLEIPRWKTKTDGNTTWFFLDHCWKFHFFFNWLPGTSKCSSFCTSGKFHVFNPPPPPAPPPPPLTVWIFSGKAQCRPEFWDESCT